MESPARSQSPSADTLFMASVRKQFQYPAGFGVRLLAAYYLGPCGAILLVWPLWSAEFFEKTPHPEQAAILPVRPHALIGMIAAGVLAQGLTRVPDYPGVLRCLRCQFHRRMIRHQAVGHACPIARNLEVFSDLCGANGAEDLTKRRNHQHRHGNASAWPC